VHISMTYWTVESVYGCYASNLSATAVTKFPQLNTRGGKIYDFRSQWPFILEMVRDRPTLTGDH